MTPDIPEAGTPQTEARGMIPKLNLEPPRRPSPRRVTLTTPYVPRPQPAVFAVGSGVMPLPSPEQIEAARGRRSGEMRHTKFARELGISPRIVREQFKRGGLPGAKEHSAYILVVPTDLLRLARAWGLRHVERMAKARLI